jgi:hypothetical protein
MVESFEILIFLFIGYMIGWFVSLFVLMIGSIKSKLTIAIAHAYAILLLLFIAQFLTKDFVNLFYTFCVFDFLAIVLFLFLYVRGMNNKTNVTEGNEIQRFINSK